MNKIMNFPQSTPFAIKETLENNVITEKLKDALTPGYQAEFDPHEAEIAGAFSENALSELEAIDSYTERRGTSNLSIFDEY